MQALTTLGVRTENFALLARVFTALRRSGRVVDMVWFQDHPDYARAVLALAAEHPEAEVRELAGQLQQRLWDFLAGLESSAA